MKIKRLYAGAILLCLAVLAGCSGESRHVEETGSRPSSQAESSGASGAASSAAASAGAGQDEAAAFMKIEPVMLKTTQNATYSYTDGKLSFTIGTDTADFPPKDVSTIFNPRFDFMPNSIFVSRNKIAVVRMPDNDSIVVTYSEDNGKSWQDSDAIHTEQIPDHAIAESTFFGKDARLLSLYAVFPSKATGFLIIGSGTTMQTQYSRALYKTTDGGKSWNYLDSNITTPDFPITGIYFADEMNGFIVQSRVNVSEVEVRRTTDGGVHWSASAITMPPGLPDDGTKLLTAFAPYNVSNQLVLPVFEQPAKLIYFTSQDRGATWAYDSTMDIGIDRFLSSGAS